MAAETALREHRTVVAAAREAVRAVPSALWEATGPDLGDLAGELGELLQACEAATVAVVGEAVQRGEPRSGELAMTPVQWLRHHAPAWRAGGAAQVVAVAEAFTVPGNAPVKDAVAAGTLPLRAAAVVVTEAASLRPLLSEGVEESVVAGMVAVAEAHGPAACRQLRSALIARYGREGVMQREQDAAKRFVALTRPRVDPLGLAEYRLTLDPEGRAVLEAALGPLSAPKPTDGERDLRTSDRRRGEALVSLVRRAVGAGEGLGPNAKTTLVVSVDLATLRSGLGAIGAFGANHPGSGRSDAHGPGPGGSCAGTVTGGYAAVPSKPGAVPSRPAGGSAGGGAGTTVGGLDPGIHLAPETMRRLACDARIIPVVLGGVSEVVDMGRARRLFTGGQTRRLWSRDGHCTFPGCDIPPQWCDAHHLVFWADGGPSDLNNAALLCERHHTIVHSRRLAARLARGPDGEHVEWDLAHGSYDRQQGDNALRAVREPA